MYLLDGCRPEDGAIGAFEKVEGRADKVMHYKGDRVAWVHVFLSRPENIEEYLHITLVDNFI